MTADVTLSLTATPTRLVPAVALVSIALLIGCNVSSRPSAIAPAGSNPTTAEPAATSGTSVSSATASTPTPTIIPGCVRQGDTAAHGVLDQRPEGWFDVGEIPVPAGFTTTTGRVYGPETITIPPYEGPGRIALYESFPGDDAYSQSRIDQSRLDGGEPTAVSICGEATEVWSIESTGELIVGWTDRGKSDVLVANLADFTIEQLVESAERVYDCCG